MSLYNFYRSKEWESLRAVIMVERESMRIYSKYANIILFLPIRPLNRF